MSEVTVEWDEKAIDDLLNSVEGPVGMFIADLSVRATIVATAVVHVRPGTASSATTGKNSDARPRGFTKASIRPHLARSARTGHLYGGVNAPADPAIFLEKPAEQEHDKYPFLTTGLWSLQGTF